jgi:hypothetical protein
MVKKALAAAKVVGAPVTVVPPAETVSEVTICVQLTLTSDLSVAAEGRTIAPAAKVPARSLSRSVASQDNPRRP